VPDRDGLDPGERRLRARLGGTEEPVDPVPRRTLGDREHSADAANASVERELADGGVSLELVRRNLTRRREHGERNREVEARSFLAQLGRREVDRDAPHRPVELR